MENVFPFLIINSSENLAQETIDFHKNISYFNFLVDDNKQGEMVGQFLPKEIMASMLSELIVIRSSEKTAGDFFGICHDLVMVFRRRMLSYLSPSLFSYNIIDIRKNENYNISEIFDRELFKNLGKKLTLFETEEFCGEFLETSMLNEYVDRSYEILYQKYRENRPIKDSRKMLYQVLKTLVNTFDIMPLGKTTSKTFFKFDAECIYSSMLVKEEEQKRYVDNLENKMQQKVDFEELFDFYFNVQNEKKISELLNVSGMSLTDESFANLTFKSEQLRNREMKNNKKNIGGTYFKTFNAEKLADLNDKEKVEIENDFDLATDIF